MSGESDELATLIGDVSHQANNSLAIIYGCIDNLLRLADLPEPVLTKLKLIGTEAYKIRDHIARLSFDREPGN